MQNEEALLAATKENIYSFLASIFLQEPDSLSWPDQAQTLSKILQELGHGPLNYGEVIPEQLSIHVENLRQEFYDCFFVPMSGRYVPPYESALLNYQPGKAKPYGSLSSPESHHVAKCYATTGFVPNQLNVFTPLKELPFPDHAGFELAFMAMLARAEKESWNDGHPEQAVRWKDWSSRFLQEHLINWWPNFTQALEAMAPGYYAQVAKVVHLWLMSELEILSN